MWFTKLKKHKVKPGPYLRFIPQLPPDLRRIMRMYLGTEVALPRSIADIARYFKRDNNWVREQLTDAKETLYLLMEMDEDAARQRMATGGDSIPSDLRVSTWCAGDRSTLEVP
jgi:hypothetical protein